MTERIAVNFGDMQHGAAQLQATMKVIYGLLDQNDADLKILDATWKADGHSDAANQYDASQKRLKLHINEMAQIVGRLGTAMSEASDHHLATERNVSQMFSG